ncbi:hypothetical protein Aspvir_009263 [Aspergillus viridinutans]|uniref:Cytochrome P450 n=1 Tax=Aspergillus viridinutans TaxID=75553 RepID=A0A9P3C4N2_ASPVI|nr:uncharacterized protein Aspvir_009263 [Aspergillus viridinutans]GIK05161.1 hypothetical protein Aspvir_009263 [Aspergillus viridinutans]
MEVLALSSLKAHAAYLVIAVVILRLITNRFRRGLAGIPGPAIAKWTRLWKLQSVWKGDHHNTAIDLHRKHGPLVRIGPKHISVGDPSAIPIIYGLNKGFTKCISWDKKPQMNLFSTRDEMFHREQKRPVANAYSMTSLLELESAVDSCTEIFVNQLARFANSKRPVDLGMWLQYYAFDVVGEFTFAKKLGFLQEGKDVDGMIEAIQGMLVYASVCGQIPEAHPLLLGNPLFPLFMPSMETWNQVLNFTLKAINSRASLQRDDTTAIALRAVFYLLLRNPSAMAKLNAEIDNADQEGKLSNPISYRESMNHLPYLQAVLKEAMRLHPSVGLILEREVPKGGITICDRHIPGGTVVGINAWVLHRDARVFPDPNKFIPERWIDSDPQLLKKMEQGFFAFGAGSRTCIGKNISLIEMHKIIPQLLREFEIRLHSPEKEWKTKNVWFVQQEGLICDLVRRRK